MPIINRTFFLFLFLITFSAPIIGAYGFGIGPPSVNLTVPIDGYNTTTVFLTADGVEGKLIIGTDNNAFKVEPEELPIDPTYVNHPIEIKVYGNETLKPGVYPDKLTFIAFTGDIVSMGIKVKANVHLYDPNPGFSLFGLNLYQMVGVVGVLIAASYIVFKQLKRGWDGYEQRH